MFKNKKIILISAVVALVIILAIGIFFYTQNKKTTVVINNPPTSGSTGSAQQSQNYSTSQITIHQDAAQPFALALPRETPAQALQNTGNGNSGNQNPQSGASSNSISPSDITNPDYQLSDSQFMDKYYQDSSQVINVNSPGYQQAEASDPVIVNNTATSQGLNVAQNPKYDPTQFKVSSDNSPAAIENYIQSMSDITGAFDLVNNPGYMQTILSNPTPAMISSDLQKTSGIIDQIKNQSVPSSVVGLSENYTAVYSDYDQMLTDLNQLNPATTTVNGKQVQTSPADTTALEGQVQLDANNLSNDIGAVNDNISSISNYFQTLAPQTAQ